MAQTIIVTIICVLVVFLFAYCWILAKALSINNKEISILAQRFDELQKAFILHCEVTDLREENKVLKDMLK